MAGVTPKHRSDFIAGTQVLLTIVGVMWVSEIGGFSIWGDRPGSHVASREVRTEGPGSESSRLRHLTKSPE